MNQTTIEEGKQMALISYITIIGVVIAFYSNTEKKNSFTAFHIRQSLGLWLTFFALGYIIGVFDSWTITLGFYIFFGVLFIFGITTALSGKIQPTPILGTLYQKIFANFGN
ncbi:hypothetical protein D7030_02125 [Flavobacteriaceae bacterium AU392]|nr:hypothetical protein D1817_08600 [Flavobacteriaceae bacterium]RKM85494.1 hypothetical protein D7030_02125 [Flavobacteriaceae bacterium AU392]